MTHTHIHTYMTHSYVCHNFICHMNDPWLVHMPHASFIHVPWLIHTYMTHVTHLYTCHDFISHMNGPWLVDMPHASFIYVPWVIHTSMTHMAHSYMCHDFIWHMNDPWLLHMPHDSFFARKRMIFVKADLYSNYLISSKKKLGTTNYCSTLNSRTAGLRKDLSDSGDMAIPTSHSPLWDFRIFVWSRSGSLWRLMTPSSKSLESSCATCKSHESIDTCMCVWVMAHTWRSHES